jgi:hypothetical protein
MSPGLTFNALAGVVYEYVSMASRRQEQSGGQTFWNPQALKKGVIRISPIW